MVRDEHDHFLPPRPSARQRARTSSTISASRSRRSTDRAARRRTWCLLRSIFQMGVPVSGKNLFPSNIAGLPTWYTIRANHRGYVSRKKEIDFLVAMNAGDGERRRAVARAGPRRRLRRAAEARRAAQRPDFLSGAVRQDRRRGVPGREAAPPRQEHDLRRRARRSCSSIELGEMEKALAKQLGKKPKAMALNMGALEAGKKYAAEHLQKRDPYRVARMNKTAGQILVEGNAAAAMGCMFAGVTVVAWYPITPSSSLPETLIGYMRKYRMDKETGKATFAIVQAEDEIAALGMVVGASWAGARAMTSTSGPGISLMSEFAGLAYYAEIPAVVFDIQRVGPSTGLADAHGAGRPALRRAQLARRHAARACCCPASVRGVLRDGDGGVRPVRAAADDRLRDERPRSRHEHLDVAAVHVSGQAARSRQGARRGEGARARRVVGPLQGRRRRRDSVAHAARHRHARRSSRAAPATTRWRSLHRAAGRLRASNVDRLARKFDTARTLVPKPVVEHDPDAKVGIIAFGSSHWAVEESRDQLREEAGLRDVVPPPARVSVHAGGRRVHPPVTTASTSSSRTATRRC